MTTDEPTAPAAAAEAEAAQLGAAAAEGEPLNLLDGSWHPAYLPKPDGAVRELRPSASMTAARNVPAEMRRATWSLDQFELDKRPTYEGKASSVFLATDKQSGTRVAIKCYHKSKLSMLNLRQIEREVALHMPLRHPNIIQLFSAFEDSRHVYLVLEAASCDLFQKLRKTSSFPEHVVQDIVYSCLKALMYMHFKGIIHRDIKPENILLSKGFEIKLADLGLTINMRSERAVTRVGTLDFMAPEVLLCPDKKMPNDHKSRADLGYTTAVDVWAIGVLAYEMLTGRAPFEGATRGETFEHILGRDPEFPGHVSENAAGFIRAALCKDARCRPTVEQLLRFPWMTSDFGEPGCSREPSAALLSPRQPGPPSAQPSAVCSDGPEQAASASPDPDSDLLQQQQEAFDNWQAEASKGRLAAYYEAAPAADQSRGGGKERQHRERERQRNASSSPTQLTDEGSGSSREGTGGEAAERSSPGAAATPTEGSHGPGDAAAGRRDAQAHVRRRAEPPAQVAFGSGKNLRKSVPPPAAPAGARPPRRESLHAPSLRQPPPSPSGPGSGPGSIISAAISAPLPAGRSPRTDTASAAGAGGAPRRPAGAAAAVAAAPGPPGAVYEQLRQARRRNDVL